MRYKLTKGAKAGTWDLEETVDEYVSEKIERKQK